MRCTHRIDDAYNASADRGRRARQVTHRLDGLPRRHRSAGAACSTERPDRQAARSPCPKAPPGFSEQQRTRSPPWDATRTQTRLVPQVQEIAVPPCFCDRAGVVLKPSRTSRTGGHRSGFYALLGGRCPEIQVSAKFFGKPVHTFLCPSGGRCPEIPGHRLVRSVGALQVSMPIVGRFPEMFPSLPRWTCDGAVRCARLRHRVALGARYGPHGLRRAV
jgi:hypothetical protein